MEHTWSTSVDESGNVANTLRRSRRSQDVFFRRVRDFAIDHLRCRHVC
jgi:hypothetical protein